MTSSPRVPNLDGLTDLAIRTGVDIRPTLLRVLTDLYVQKSVHAPEDERHYTELALRLIAEVDVQTKRTVALRLVEHRDAPAAVVQHLADHLPDIAAMLARRAAHPASTENVARAAHGSADARPPLGAGELGAPAEASELNELFFAAASSERRLILLNLEYVDAQEPRSTTARERIAAYLLEAAALAYNDEEFAQQLARSLRIGREQALRIIRDPSGEPLVIAAKALHVPSDVLQRILLFLNPEIGHSVERVHGLAKLYDEIAPQAADHLVAIWRMANPPHRIEAAHRPHYWDDDRRQARPGPAPDARRPATVADEANTDRRLRR